MNLSNTTITTMTAAMTTIPRLNASVIINAINAKVKSIYDTNSEAAIITKIGNKNTVR